MRLGIVGCGQIVLDGHVPALLRAEHVEVVATSDVVRSRAELVARAFAGNGRPRAPRAYGDHRDMLERERLDLVLVGSPPSLHRRHVADAAAAGVHVLCEKPLATTLADAEAAVLACEESEVRLLMAHNYASFEEYRRLPELIRSGAIGVPHTAIFQGLGSNPWDGAPEYRPGWRYDASLSGGGRLMDAGVHALYLAEMVFGAAPVRVSAWMDFGPAGAPIDSRCFARYRFPTGVALLQIGEGHGGCAVEAIGEEGRIQLRFPNGRRYFDHSPGELHVYVDGELKMREQVPPRTVHLEPCFYADVAERLTGPHEYLHSGRHGRDLLATLLATYVAASEGRDVDLPPELSEALYAEGAAAAFNGSGATPAPAPSHISSNVAM